MTETTVTYAPGTPCWIDLGSPDVEKSRAFYTAVFGWEADIAEDPAYGGYTTFRHDGKAVCGLSGLMSPDQPSTWNTYVRVEDVDATLGKAAAAGGMVAMEGMTVPGQGRMGCVIDPAGAAIFLWQTMGHPGSEWVNDVAGWCWSELNTRDFTSPEPFYKQLFNWDAKASNDEAMPYVQWELNGRSIAGMMPMAPQVPAEVPSFWMTYFTVADVDESCRKITEAGGTVQMPKFDTPQGPMAVVADNNGTVFSIISLRV